MQLTPDQLTPFDTDGYLLLPDRISVPEVAVLKRAAAVVLARDREAVWRETSGIARTACAAHT